MRHTPCIKIYQTTENKIYQPLNKEIIMTANIKTNTYEGIKETTTIQEEASKTTIKIGIAMAALVGLWGFACLIGGLATAGVGGTVIGYLRAVTGV